MVWARLPCAIVNALGSTSLIFVLAKQEPSGFLWLGQGVGAPPQWFLNLRTLAHTEILWGSFRNCTEPHICMKGRTNKEGRNVLYAAARLLEFDRGPFFYIIFADDNGDFTYRNCSPVSCGDASLRPLDEEDPKTFFHRLLLEDEPAVAAPIDPLEGFTSFSYGL